MNNWKFNNKDLEMFIKTGENLLQKKLTKTEQEEILYEIKILKSIISGDFNYDSDEETNDMYFYQAKNYYLNEMKKIYKQLGKNVIDWLIALENEQLFYELFNAPQITLPIEEQKEYTLKNYEQHSKKSLPIVKQILSPYPTNQIHVNYDLEETSFSRHYKIANLPLIIINPDEGAAILNHEIQHALESTVSYNTNYFYKELGSIFYEILFNNLIFYKKSILPTERLEDFAMEFEILSDYLKLIVEFAKYDFKVSVKDFKSIVINKLEIIPTEIEDWLNEELEFDYEGEIKYKLSQLKAIELVSRVNKKQDTLDLIEPYINTKKIYFETNFNNFKIYESYINDVKQKILKK